MRFEFATAGRIIFGPGALSEIGPIAKSKGRRALVVTGRSTDRARPLLSLLEAHNVSAVTFPVTGEPTVVTVTHGAEQARAEHCDLVIGMGGGSAIDAAKAIAALITNTGDVFDYLEIVGQGRPLNKPAAPCVAIPTTAGTGAEVTRNAVLGVPAHRVKASLRGPLLLPKVAIVDPTLAYDLPPAITATTGLDALTQLIEAFVSVKANPLTDAVCLEGLQRAARSLRRAWLNGHDAKAREDMALASLFSGLALANAGLGAVHGFAAPIGGRFPASHGAVCAALLPHVMDVNGRALRSRAPGSQPLCRYDTIARILTGKNSATAADGIGWVRELCQEFNVPPLSTHGVNADSLASLIEDAANASSMKGNPIVLTIDEKREILTQAL